MAQGLIKGFTGVDDPYEAPTNAEISIKNNLLTVQVRHDTPAPRPLHTRTPPSLSNPSCRFSHGLYLPILYSNSSCILLPSDGLSGRRAWT